MILREIKSFEGNSKTAGGFDTWKGWADDHLFLYLLSNSKHNHANNTEEYLSMAIY